MFRVDDKLYSFVALLFVFLSLLGYQLVTTLLLPLSSNETVLSRMVTYPYRALMFALAFFLIITYPKTKRNKQNGRNNQMVSIVAIYYLFMLVYFIRILIDIFIKQIYVQPSFKIVILQYMFISIIPYIWAMSRCALYVDYRRLLQWLMIGGCILLGITFMNQNTLIAAEYDDMTRGQGNIALGSIGFGHTCVSLFIIFLSWIVCYKTKKWIWNIFLIGMMTMSIVLMLHAASRGPLLAFLVVILLYLFSRMKNKVLGVFIALLFLFIVWYNMSSILNWMGSISPLMERRMAAAMYEDDSSGRDLLYREAIDIFLKNPLFGRQFVLNNGLYSHNSILDVLISLGVFGALVWVFLIFQNIKLASWQIMKKGPMMAVSLLSVQFIFKGLLSGAIYIDDYSAICMTIVLSVSRYEYIGCKKSPEPFKKSNPQLEQYSGKEIHE